MKSRAAIKSHPLHPMLIPFPFAFLTGAVVFDVLGWITGAESYWTTGRYLLLAGIGTGLLAAVPGLVDYLTVVPPESSGKRRATLHMLSNGGALTLFAVVWVIRSGVLTDIHAHAPLLLVEIAALGLLSAGGWMGGTLVYRNQIGIDHRYANAGKWQEASHDASAGEDAIPVGRPDDLDVNQMKLLHVGGRRIVLGRTEDGCAAFEDRCTHRGGSLADGVLICGTVQCPWHGSQFDVSTGKVQAGPATKGIEAFEIRTRSGELRLDLTAARGRGPKKKG